MTGKLKPYPKYKESGIEWLGKVPEHWVVRRLGFYFHERKEKVSDQLYKPLSVTKKGIVPQLENAAKTDDGDNRKKVCKGDFVINSRSDRKGSSGLSKLTGSVSLINTVLSPQNIDASYTEWLMKSEWFQEEFYRYGKGIVADLWSTNYSEMKNIILPIAYYDEQTTIANYLDKQTTKIDKLIENYQKLITLSKEKRTALITHCVTKGLDPTVKMKNSGVEWLGEVPKHWDINRLKRVLSEPLKYGANESAELDETSFPRYIRIIDFGDDGILRPDTFKSLPPEKANSFLLKEGDILFARSGATVGKTFQFKNYIGSACFAGYLIKASVNTNNIISDYLNYFTNSSAYNNWKSMICIQATIQNIGADKYSELILPIPPIQEQTTIANYLDQQTAKIDQTIEKAQQAIELLKEKRTALITAVVTGKVDVRECV